MTGLLSTPARRRISALLAALFLVAIAVPVGAAGPPGNNGTVKIHSGAETEPNPEIKNEPHVSCPFHMHFFFADTHQTGDWTIEFHPPTGRGVAATGSYDTGDGTSFVTEPIFLGAGHYHLSWDGRNAKNQKHKTFWVDGDCDEGGGGGGGGGGDEG